MARCRNPNHKAFPEYGGRGIRVCERWLDFTNFLAGMGERPPRHSLERKNNDLGYFPENCKWATRAEQAKNRKCTRYVEIGGRMIALSEALQEYGINRCTFYGRIARGWPLQRALTQPAD